MCLYNGQNNRISNEKRNFNNTFFNVKSRFYSILKLISNRIENIKIDHYLTTREKSLRINVNNRNPYI